MLNVNNNFLAAYRVLVVAAFKTYELADLRTKIRFENFSHSTMILGTKFPGIRIEKLDKSGSGDSGRPSLRPAAVGNTARRRLNKQNVICNRLQVNQSGIARM